MEKSPAFTERRIAGKLLLMPLEAEAGGMCLYELCDVAAFLWDRLPQASEDALAEALSEAFDVSRSEAAADVADLLAELVAIGAIRPSAPSRPAGARRADADGLDLK